jgi:hypothetical protein
MDMEKFCRNLNRLLTPILPVRFIGGTTLISTLFEINWLLAFFTDMFAVELIGENLFFRTTIITFANKRFEIFERLKARTMVAWGIHAVLLFIILKYFHLINELNQGFQGIPSFFLRTG